METAKDKLLGQIRELIDISCKQAIVREDAEIRSGKVLRNDPKSRLLYPPFSSANPPPIAHGQTVETLRLWFPSSNSSQNMAIVTGKTTYFTSRRMWSAYPIAIQLLRKNGITDEACLYRLFHYVTGVAYVVERLQERTNFFLLGVRSGQLAGTHTNMISVPAGLLEPGEKIVGARELLEETGIGQYEITHTIATRNLDAPNTTFVHRVLTSQKDIAETFEVKGKTFIWVGRKMLANAIATGNMAPLAKKFRQQGIAVPDSLKIAPDILQGLIFLHEKGII